ncbi:MAG: c-type cytochrome [Weeksellaceae bacterium]
MKSKLYSKIKFLGVVLVVTAFTFSYSQDTPNPQDSQNETSTSETSGDSGDEIKGDLAHGLELFQQHCTACHKIDGAMVGPELRNVVARVKEEGGVGRQWLHDWIKDNAALRESGDKYAIEVYEKNNKIPMLAFPTLSEQDIDDILAYTSDPEGGQKLADEAKAAKAAAAAEATPAAPSGVSLPTGVIIAGYIILGLLLLFVLLRLSSLIRMIRKGPYEYNPEVDNLGNSFANFINRNSKLTAGVLGLLALVALYGLWIFMFNIGVDKGYQPQQPIYFSHQVHAGVQGIDCQFCHSSAKYGKVSGIPSPNLCMNCHKSINEYRGDYYEEELVSSGRFANADQVKDFYTGEIHKMYDAIGWDPEQAAFTGEQKPIEWVRIHNMPDFVYFSHEQHVVAGEQAILKAIKDQTIPNSKELNLPDNSQVCFACHGDVPKMDELKMANDFTMGWCVECHRNTEVDMTNGYNSQYYADLHEKLKKEYGEGTKITVDAIGGLECAKCHY